jgi:hypothetical protein
MTLDFDSAAFGSRVLFHLRESAGPFVGAVLLLLVLGAAFRWAVRRAQHLHAGIRRDIHTRP